MPAQRLTMRRVRELLRLHYGIGASARRIARELGVSRSTVQEYLARVTAAGLTWPLADEITDGVLDERLFAASGAKPGARRLDGGEFSRRRDRQSLAAPRGYGRD